MTTNIFSDIPTNLPEELFTLLLENKNVRIERIVSEGHRTPVGEWYAQTQNEWVIVLQGQAVVEYENMEQHTLNVGDYWFIPAHTRHRVAWTIATQQTVWLAIHWL
ncbi:MAG: cupin domain-containing protein [Methylococcales bacterium]|nr:cupin domain-containing protein [Methylococcales bacterium]